MNSKSVLDQLAQPAHRAGRGRTAEASARDASLSLADVLEQELAEIRGSELPAPLPWTFTAEQMRQPVELRARLVDGRDPVSRGLAADELSALVITLRAQGAPKDAAATAALCQDLADAFNALLERADLYPSASARGAQGRHQGQKKAQRFEGLRLRSQTSECIEAGPISERNRLILEDAFPEIQRRDDARLAAHFAQVHRHKMAALCLSGGGIRSASFGLGVVQGLARLGLIKHFDYLSTVSGGGYLGGWLSAWIQRAGRDHVVKALTEGSGRPLAPEPGPISHIRTYSSYLSPHIGIRSADTWTLVAIYLRNLLLNWFVLIPLLAAALATPQLLIALTRLPHREPGGQALLSDDLFVGVVGLLCLLIFSCAVASVRYVHANLPLRSPDGSGAVHDPKRDHRSFIRWCLLPILAAVVGGTIVWAWIAAGKVPLVTLPNGPGHWQLLVEGWPRPLHSAWAWCGAGALAHLLGWLLVPRQRSWSNLVMILVTGGLGGLAVGAIAHSLVPDAPARSVERLQQYANYISFAVPALLATVLVFGHVYVGLTSRRQSDPMFEWTARSSAWLLMTIFAWLLGFGIVILAPLGLAWIVKEIELAGQVGTTQVIGSVVGLFAGAATLRQAFEAPIAPGQQQVGKPALAARLGQLIGLPIFLFTLFALLSYFVGWLMELGDQLTPMFKDYSCSVGDGAAAGSEGSHGHYGAVLNAVVCGSVWSAGLVVLALIGGGLLLSLRIDTNRFSLHGMYRARLIRTFLGASRTDQERDPNRFTGFDEADDMPLADCLHRGRPAPFLVVNAALNLVNRDELSSQQRKAMSYTFTPLHCGASRLGYRQTKDYAGGLSLGTVVTISGAAASPEMGYHSTPLLSFLLTLFNIRLGWWLGNPGYAGRHNFRQVSPASSVKPIIDEALGRTDDQNASVYLSDGGHFENLGLYEMVLRRCHWIVASDAGCDSQGAFEDLGNAIRRIQVDFGIPITFTKVPIYCRDGGNQHETDATYCAIGRIMYSEVDGPAAEDGILIYIKPAFYGTEPPDVFNYARTSPDFPHESTANQFFTEAQFESYRRLGQVIIEHITPPLAAGSSPGSAPTTQAPQADAAALDQRSRALDAVVCRVASHLHASGASRSM